MLRFGLVGFGYWGPNLARNFSRQPDCELAAICELAPARRELAGRTYPGARITADYADLLADGSIQAILIATPVSSHHGLAREAILAGKDVFVEKPLTETTAQGEELVRLAAQHGRILAVDHTFLFTGAVQKIKEITTSGELGEILYFDSVRINLGLFQDDVNVIHDLAPHDLSILNFLVGQGPTSVRAVGACHAQASQEHMAYIHLEYASGMVAHFHFSWLAPVKIRRTIIGGTRKMIVYDDLEPSEKVKVYDKGIVVNGGDIEALNKVRIDYRVGDMVAPKLMHREALDFEAEHFAACVRERTRPMAAGEDGLMVTRIIEAAQRSLREGGRKIVPGEA